jgi:hypothetical protein
MDNKQATPTDLAYLAGIIDGEGWIGLQKRLDRRWVTYKPALRITNTDPNIINRVYEIWEGLGVSGHIYENTQDPSVSNGKTIMNLQLNKQSVIKTVIEAVIPFLVGKKARAIMLLRFLDKSVDREEAYQSIKAANKKGVGESSETTRETLEMIGTINNPVVLSEDIVQTA